MSELRHECGLAAIYCQSGAAPSGPCPTEGPGEISRLLPRMLLDIQTRGQLSAGMTTYRPGRRQLLKTHKDLGSVGDVFRMSHAGRYERLMKQLAGSAAIGQVRYATCGEEDRNYAQPLERHDFEKRQWFSLGYNGQLANYSELRAKLLGDGSGHLTCENDTEIIMHEISRELSGGGSDLVEVFRNVASKFDGAYNLVFLNALGEMVVLRDPLGIRPLCYAKEGSLFAAASESVALVNMGFRSEDIRSLLPGQMALVGPQRFELHNFARSSRRAHCFFEWIYFANMASTLDDRNVYLARQRLGEELARLETEPLDDNTVVVPVPETSRAAADAMAFRLRVPAVEGLIRNRYTGRTFIEGNNSRQQKAETKYTPVREVLEGKRVLLVEDSIVRSTTMKVLIHRLRELGGVREIHVRVACPPIIAPCFYGIDMSTVAELFAPQFLRDGQLTDDAQMEMARRLGADSLRYLPVEAIARSIGFDADQLCQACITGKYPTPCGQTLYQIALTQAGSAGGHRTYEAAMLRESV